MKGSQDPVFKNELKKLILEACDREESPEQIADDAPLFGDGAALRLDSVDGLQISMALQKRYGVRLTDSKEMRRVFTSVNALADFLRPG